MTKSNSSGPIPIGGIFYTGGRKGWEIPLKILKSYKEVLRVLAAKGSTIKYQIAKESNLTNSAIYKAVDDMERLKMVEKVRRKGTSRAGLPIQVYSLTVWGLARALYGLFQDQVPEKAEKEVREIIKANADLVPLVFKKWDYFKQLGLEKQASLRLKQAAFSIAERVFLPGDFIPMEQGSEEWWWNKPDNFTYHFFYPLTRVNSPYDASAWYDALQGDPDLRKWAILRLRYLENVFADRLNFVRQAKAVIQGAGPISWPDEEEQSKT